MELLQGDCLKLLRELPTESVDCVVTDPPYRTVGGGCTTGTYMNRKSLDEAGAILASGKMFEENDVPFNLWLPEVYRVLKDGTHCYSMISPRHLKELQQAAENAGFIYQNLIVWDKGQHAPTRYYLNAYELILMLRKGKARNINLMGTKNLLRVQGIRGEKQHPTEKPVGLMEILVENSTNPGELVLDPFMGVGTTGVACKNLNRNFIGIELDKKYFDKAQRRLVGE